MGKLHDIDETDRAERAEVVERTNTSITRMVRLRANVPFYKSIAFRITAVLFLPLALCLWVLSASEQLAEQGTESYNNIRALRNKGSKVAQGLMLKAAEGEALAYRYVAVKDPHTRESFQKSWENISGDLRRIEDAATLGDRPRLRKLAAELRKGTQDYAALAGEVFALGNASRLDELSQTRQAIQIVLQKLMAENDVVESDIFTEAEKRFEADSKEINRIVVIGLTLALFLCGLLSFTLTRNVNRMAARCRQIAEGEGDLTRRFNSTGGDEVSAMTRSFDQFLDKTSALVATIAKAAAEVTGTTAGVADASHRVTQSSQALRKNAALEQLSMDRCQIAVTKLQDGMETNLGRIRQTVDLASVGQEQARQGALRITDAFEKVKQALSSTKSVGEHLTTLSQIAHETKVLSINAAIEACKAGPQGTGFYLIAEDIRKLSETATKLTRELSDFMEKSNSQAQEGSALAQDANAGLDSMVATVDGISRQVTDMGGAYEDHQAHVTEVFEQVKVLTITIESNAGSVTQAADAAKRLSAQATALQELIGALNDTVNQFQIAKDATEDQRAA
jgi:methyl-accepting chemotaxis protein